MENATKTVLLCGVGGQGTILAADLLAFSCMKAGLQVKVSEIHGMAQRGGAVTTVVRVGALAARLDIPVEVWEETVAERVPQKTVEANLAALRAGRAVIENEEGK